MSRDIVDISTSSDRLVVAIGVKGELSDQLACVEIEDADVAIGDEELDRTALVGPAENPRKSGWMRSRTLFELAMRLLPSFPRTSWAASGATKRSASQSVAVF